MTYCPQCGTGNLDSTRFCTSCGASTTPTSVIKNAPVEEPSDPLIGRTIEGKYRFDAKLGAGGMGAVYKATRLLIGDTVAIKVLHPAQMGTVQASERFRREAQAAARFKHPNSVAIYDFGVTSDGLLYLIMEIAEGQSLRDLITEKGALPPATAAEIMRQACAALDEAHRHEIVHRDIKPDNIMVKTTASGLQVKVLDFGIAKLKDLAGGTDTLTQFGSVIGTPHYMSPEQCLGEELDGRSDNYSLGVVLYEMLSGLAPFRANTSREIISKQISQPPPPIRSLRPELPPALEDVVQQMLAKEREDRPQTAAVLSTMLNNALNVATPKQSGPPPIPNRPPVPNQPQAGGMTGYPKPVPTTHPQPIITPHSQLRPGYITPPPAKKRSWVLPFIIGGIIVFILFIVLIIFLAALGSMDQSKEPGNPGTAAATASPADKPTPSAAQVVPATNTNYQSAVTVTATASSTRATYRGISYAPNQMLDGSMMTAWIEGARGPGIGQWVQFDFSREVNLKSILLAPGYFKSQEVWAKNNRLAVITLQFSDGGARQYTFPDQMTEQSLDVLGIHTSSVRLVIDRVYMGRTDSEDTAISQIAFEYGQ